MNALVILAVVSCAFAAPAPGGVVSQFPASTAPLGATVVAAPALVRAAPAVVAAPAVAAVTTHAVAPAVAHVSVPIQKTIHYETKPVVTGYSTSIIKPAIPDIAHPVFAPTAVQTVVNAPVQTVVAAAPAPVVAAPAPVVADAEIVEARVAAPAPVVHAVPAAVAVRPALAADFEPLVTKQEVLAPVRTHTHITPQVTQVVPEVTVRKVVHDVPIQQVVGVQTPVVHQVAQPLLASPVGFNTGFINTAGHFVL